MQLRLTVGSLEGEHLRWSQVQLIKRARVARRQFGHQLAVEVAHPRHRRLVVRLFDIDEVFAVRRHDDAMRHCGIGQALVASAIQAHAMQLHLHVVVARPRRVPQPAGRLVDLDDVDHLEAMPRQLRQLFSGKIVEIEVPEVRALRHPDETLAIRQKARARAARPCARPRLAHHAAAFTRCRRAGRKIIVLLEPVSAADQDFGSLLRPLRSPRIMANHLVSEGCAIAHIHHGRLSGGDVVHQQVGDRVRFAGMRVGLHQHGRQRLRLVELQEVILDRRFVIAHPRQLFPVRRPPHRLRDVELLEIDVRADAVADAPAIRSVRRQLYLRPAIDRHEPDIAIARDRPRLSIGRHHVRLASPSTRQNESARRRGRRPRHPRRSRGRGRR